MKQTLVIATRSSRLALWQAEHIRERLLKLQSGLTVELLQLKTRGDIILDSPLAQVGGKGLFVKEIQEALLDRRAQVAVHSLKDYPAETVPGLSIAAVPEREDPSDAFVSNRYARLAELPQGSLVGTSSLRRQSQLLHHRPDLRILMLRGNVETRLRKLDEGEYDAIILASAGLKRLELAERIRESLDKQVMLPAVGQGALGIECRDDDLETYSLLSQLNHRETRARVTAERAFLRHIGGSCQVPVGGYATLVGETTLRLEAFIASPDGRSCVREHLTAPLEDGYYLGTNLAEKLLSQGGKEILEQLPR